jgi:NitT/TauT family transport system substrate-binding protein
MPRSFVPSLALLAALTLAACGPSAPAAAPNKPAAPAAPAQPAAAAQPGAPPPAPVLLRWSTIENANQAYIPILLRDKGIGAKYGLDVQIIPISNTGQQWNSMRAGEADISSGSVLDLLRQRQAGLQAKAIRNWATFSNPIVALADKPYAKLSDLRGARVGTPTDTLLDWMILRAAGARAEGFDLSRDAQVQNAAPGLLNGLLDKGDLDAALQFSDFTLAPLSQGKYKEVTTVPKAMAAGQLDPESLYLTYNLADAWRARNSDAVPRLVAAIEEATQILMSDDAIWPELAKRSGIEDPALLQPYVRMQRESFKAVWGAEKLAPTQAVLDALNETVGASPVGVARADPAAFDFDAAEAAKRLR